MDCRQEPAIRRPRPDCDGTVVLTDGVLRGVRDWEIERLCLQDLEHVIINAFNIFFLEPYIV